MFSPIFAQAWNNQLDQKNTQMHMLTTDVPDAEIFRVKAELQDDQREFNFTLLDFLGRDGASIVMTRAGNG